MRRKAEIICQCILGCKGLRVSVCCCATFEWTFETRKARPSKRFAQKQLILASMCLNEDVSMLSKFRLWSTREFKLIRFEWRF